MTSPLESALLSVAIYDEDQAPIAILDLGGEVLYGNEVWQGLGPNREVKITALKSLLDGDRHPFLEDLRVTNDWPIFKKRVTITIKKAF